MANPMTSYFWDAVNPNNSSSGISGAPSAPATDVSTGKLGQVGILAQRGVLSPDHPMFFFGVVLAATLGLVAVSTHVKVGPIKGDLSV